MIPMPLLPRLPNGLLPRPPVRSDRTIKDLHG
jgi:hypothetical protein